MRSHAKASSAEPTRRHAAGLGRLLRAATSVAALGLVALVFASAASATKYQRPFKEVFGSAAQPTFSTVEAIAVDRSNGDLLVADRGTGTSLKFSRFNPDGTPAPFTALGSNVIDGKEANGKPCAEEPASCDKTKQNGLGRGTAGIQIAVDNSGGPTNGDIYITQFLSGSQLVDIFASDGRYLGQLTATGLTNFRSGPCGVAVDQDGTVYLGIGGEPGQIVKFVPSANPPVNSDYTATYEIPGHTICNLALGTGPTAGSIFSVNNGGADVNHAYKIDAEAGELDYLIPSDTGEDELRGKVAVDPTTGNVLFASLNKPEVKEYDASGASAPVRVGRLINTVSQVVPFATGNSGDVYIAAAIGAGSGIRVYGAPAIVPTAVAELATNVIGTKATLNGTVDPEGLAVSECFFKYGETTSYGNTAPCEGTIPTDSNPHPVHLNISGLKPNGHTYHYRLFAKNANGTEESADQTLVTASTVATEAATVTGTGTATLHGTLRPEGDEYSECSFEYGLSSSPGFEHVISCDPPPATIPPDFAPHPVSATIGGLQKGTTYRFRLVATDPEGTLKGEELTFHTFGEPQITEIRARDADQSSATLEAKINPSGFGTSYRFEWGATTAYGHRVPADFEPFVGSGIEPVRVSAEVSGLTAGTAYHYRVVATSSVGTTESPDQEVETLNSCGLSEGRCFELVSPRDVGPVAQPGTHPFVGGVDFQADLASGGLAYIVESGFPDSTRGAEVLYLGRRNEDGWSASQLSAPILARNETKGNGGNSDNDTVLGLSHDLSCGVSESNQPLTDDLSAHLVVEAGGRNLYRHNPDGSYTVITKLPPENLAAVQGGGSGNSEYIFAGASQDCDKVVFTSEFRYPGVAGVGENLLYEWDEGTLRNVGLVPGPSGETTVEAVPGAGAGVTENHTNTVSEDGSRVFFTAERQTSDIPAEIGKTGVFARENGTVTRDLSLSETSTPDTGATYQWATPDGSRVFFTANAGLTNDSSSEGTDLYEYNLESEELTDLSIDHDAGGAEVAGFVGASQDGSRVYFVARGQLVPGKGKAFAQNQSDKIYSLYGEKDGVVKFVGAVDNDRVSGRSGLADIAIPPQWTSRVSPDGRYLLFESGAKVTGYEGNGNPEAYLYDDELGTGSEATICISCRQDGKASVARREGDLYYSVLTYSDQENPLNPPQSLVIRDGNPQVFFSSLNRLAPGASEGETNLYEWSHNQVTRIATQPPGLLVPEDQTKYIPFLGASADGTDLYFSTPQTLTWEDGDGRYSVYDARIEGGFPEPPPVSSAPCEPTSEGSCQGAASQGPASTPTPGSTSFNGPGNAKPKAQHKKKRHKRHHRKRKARHAKHERHANGNRRAGK